MENKLKITTLCIMLLLMYSTCFFIGKISLGDFGIISFLFIAVNLINSRLK